MSAATLLSAIAPQFDSNPNRNTFISLAEMQTNRCWFKSDKGDFAVALLAAHILTLNTSPEMITGAGAVTSKREGDLAVSYAAPRASKSGDDYFSLTIYGKQYIALRDQGGMYIGVTGGNLNGLC